MWHRRSVDDDVLRALKPTMLEAFAQSLGWTTVQIPHELAAREAVLQSPADPVDQIRVPKATQAPDFLDVLRNAVFLLAEATHRDPAELAEDVRFYRSDRLDFRQIGETVSGGQIRLSKGVELLAAAKQAVSAAAHSVGFPQARFHPRLSKKEPAALIDECFVSTSSGSFIATVACPIDVEGAAGLGRDAVARLLSAASFVRTLESGHLDLVEAAVDDDAPWPVSANLCEALAAMEPEDDDGALELRARWARALPGPDAVPVVVKLETQDFEKVRSLAVALRPSEGEQPGLQHYLAWIESLSGTRTEGGTAEIKASQEDSPEWFKATVNLGAGNEWEVAYKALGIPKPVLIRGGLRLKRRQPHVIEPLRSIKIAPDENE